jgi:heterodisulfide reductase subunit A
MENLAGMLKDAGFSPERLKVAWIAASEGEKFARTVETFVDELELLGPVGSELPEAEP